MPVYKFDADFSVDDSSLTPPHGLRDMPAIRQLSHVEGGRNPFDGTDFMSYPSYLEEFLTPGFRALDDAMKQYWAGIRVPTKDSYRFMRVKVAGGDKSLLIWADDIHEGRVKLPVAAIDRGGVKFNSEKFSPPIHRMGIRYLSRDYDQAAVVYRPTPWLVDYSLIVWAEHKRDIEYILYQVLQRFNPLAEFRMSDGKISGNVQIRLNGSTDTSDKEAGFDQQAKVRYEIGMTAEAWLPLPERVLKTVLGRTTIIRERTGTILEASRLGGKYWYTPT